MKNLLAPKRSVASITKGLTTMIGDLTTHADLKVAEMAKIDDQLDALQEKRAAACAEHDAAVKVAANIQNLLGA